MAKLKQTEILKLDKLLDFSSGYVLDFTNATFTSFFQNELGINIYDDKYGYYGGSKGKRLRAFIELENDKTVGKAIIELLDIWKTNNLLNDTETSPQMENLGKECERIANKLRGIDSTKIEKKKASSEQEFLNRTFEEINFEKISIEKRLIEVLNQRIREIQNGLESHSALSVVFLCGSSLEGILLGIASQKPKLFNSALASPKNKEGKVKDFYDWSLSDLINVAYEVGFLGLDVKKHSHSLRDFRNYIHPFQQMSEGFNPDQHTAEISWQVFRAAFNDLLKSRN